MLFYSPTNDPSKLRPEVFSNSFLSIKFMLSYIASSFQLLLKTTLNSNHTEKQFIQPSPAKGQIHVDRIIQLPYKLK